MSDAPQSATFEGSRSMRENYNSLGVDAYYQQHGAGYRNPHFPNIVAALRSILDIWIMQIFDMHKKLVTDSRREATVGCGSKAVRFLDLACGSGEATQALEIWWNSRKHSSAAAAATAATPKAPANNQATPQPSSATGQHKQECCNAAAGHADLSVSSPSSAAAMHAASVAGAVAQHGMHANSASSSNNQGQTAARPALKASIRKNAGMQGLPLPSWVELHVDACDPYTCDAYHTWTGRTAEPLSFADVAEGCLLDRAYHVCICSFALHLLDDGRLFSTLLQLSLVTEHLIVLSPHKRPSIGPHTGWELQHHVVVERVHAWLYHSLNLQKESELDDFL